jgi:hypothetical protein
MAYQMTFQRYELKYMLTRQQKEQILQAMTPYMALDRYGRSTIRNIYFDTENFRLIRRSIERPVYKEKLRLRSYTQAKADTPVFVELKKKYRSVVYKRRLDLPEQKAMDCLCAGVPLPVQSQIASEIDYFLHYYQTLRPAVFLSYEREAYYPLDGGDFRVTFDHNILYRRNELSLCAGVWGSPLLQNDQVLMEIKTSGGIPLWMTQVLTREHIHKTSYSKYGSAYEQILQSQQKGELRYA